MIRAISSDKPFYRKMLSAAQEKGMKEFSYKDISKRSIIKGV